MTTLEAPIEDEEEVMATVRLPDEEGTEIEVNIADIKAEKIGSSGKTVKVYEHMGKKYVIENPKDAFGSFTATEIGMN